MEFSGDREPGRAGRGGSPPDDPVIVSTAELGAATPAASASPMTVRCAVCGRYRAVPSH